MKSDLNSDKIKSKNNKILVVEDNDDQWTLIKHAISECFNNVTVMRAATTQQALTLFEEWQQQEWDMPRLILLDLYLPQNEDGWRLLRQIKAMSAAVRRIPIVMLTSSTDYSDIGETYQLGVSSYLVKPIDFTGWLELMCDLRIYWWETATFPPVQYGF